MGNYVEMMGKDVEMMGNYVEMMGNDEKWCWNVVDIMWKWCGNDV